MERERLTFSDRLINKMKLFNGRGILGLAATALFALLLLAGCGGGDSNASDAQPQTKAEFVKQAEAICRQDHKELKTELTALRKEAVAQGESPGVKQTGKIAEDLVLPSLQSQLEKLDELGLPQDAEAKVGAYLETLEGVIAEGEGDASTLIGSQPWQRLGKAAKALGLKECPEAL